MTDRPQTAEKPTMPENADYWCPECARPLSITSGVRSYECHGCRMLWPAEAIEGRPSLLDLFCCAGGAAMGYHRAGFNVTGVDIKPQPNYPFTFHQADAMTFPLDGFHAVHASPPCQDHSSLRSGYDPHGTGWMLDATIERFRSLSVPWVVENVVGPTVTMDGWWFILCGSSFGLRVRRHRRFGSNLLMLSPPCRHQEQGTPLGVYGHGGGGQVSRGFKAKPTQFTDLMGMPWAKPREIVQAIPPAYTEWIGDQLLHHITTEGGGVTNTAPNGRFTGAAGQEEDVNNAG